MFNLEREALIVSGVKGEGEVTKYLRKLDSLVLKYMPGIPLKASQLERARAAFEFLWSRHPCRYLMKGAFELNHVIDAHFGAADIYQSAGTKLFQQGELKEALSHYNLALQLNPRYAKARLNRAILLDRMRFEDDRSMSCRPYQCDIQ